MKLEESNIAFISELTETPIYFLDKVESVDDINLVEAAHTVDGVQHVSYKVITNPPKLNKIGDVTLYVRNLEDASKEEVIRQLNLQ